MIDQATTLRTIARTPEFAAATRPALFTEEDFLTGAPAKPARTIAIASGKGGVGKSNIAVNVSIELAALNRRVSLLDADLALANADVLLGLNPRYHLGHVLDGQKALSEVVIDTRRGFRLIPGGSGVEELANLTLKNHRQLIAELHAMECASDYMLIDSPAGIAHNVTGVLSAAHEVVIVTTPDPTAVVDAYATIKVLHGIAPRKPVSLIVNDVVGIGDADTVFSQLRNAAKTFLHHEIEFLGSVPRDAELAEAVREQVPVVEYAPTTPAARALRLIAKHLDRGSQQAHEHSPRSFWSALSGS